VLNRTAGRGRAAKYLPAVERSVASLRRRGLDVELEQPSSTADTRERARHAAHAGRDLVAGGGDGTVSAVAGIAAETRRRLALLPLGSGNDFARTLGYDTDEPLRALEYLTDEAGRDRTVDLGRVNGQLYTCVTCSGFDAEANRWANERSRLSGTALYVAAVLRTIVVYRPRRFRVTVDGRVRELRAWMVSVGNGPAYAGGMRIVPDANMNDGLLDVCIIGPISKARFVANFPKVFKGTHGRVAEVAFDRGAHVEVEALETGPNGVPLEVWADGERVGPLPATMQAVAGALVVRTPPP